MSEIANLDLFFGVIVQKSIFASVLVAALLLLTRLGRSRISPRMRFAIWFLLPIQLLFFVSIPSQWSVKNFLGPQASSLRMTETVPMVLQPETPTDPSTFDDLPFWSHEETAIGQVGQVSPAVHRTAEKMFPVGLLTSIWLGGVLLFAGCYAAQLCRLRRDIHAGSVVVDPHVLRIFEDCKHRMNINSWIMLVESSRIPGPFLIGVFRPVIVVPAGLPNTLTPEELRHLFFHELAHLKRGDLISGWVMSFVLALHWFNPLIWVAVSTMNHLREEAADAAVCEQLEGAQSAGEDRFDYIDTLLTLSRQPARPRSLPVSVSAGISAGILTGILPGILTGILETQNFLQRRIDMITSPVCRQKSWAVLALFVCAMLSLVLLTDAKPQEKANDTTKEATQSPVTEKIAAEKIDPQRVPKIVNMFPKNNSKGVDPNIPQVVLLFDIPMGGGFSFAQRSDQTAIDGEEGVPPFWTADKKACVMPVKLKPGKTYEIMVNIPPFTSFRSVDGVEAEGVFYTFSTARMPISEEGRQKYAARVLTPKDNAPDAGPAEPAKQSAEQPAKENVVSTLSPELQSKANDAFKTMMDRSGFWLLGKTQGAKNWGYHAKIFSTTNKEMEVLEHDIYYERAKGVDWDLKRGTSSSGLFQAIANLYEKDQQQVQWTNVEFGNEEIKMAFALKQPTQVSYGNGMLGAWYGYFSRGKIYRGVLILDAKTMMPKTAYTSDGFGEQFGDYVQFAENVYVPKKIQVKNGDMNFLMEFKVYEPDLWLLEKSTYSVKTGNENFGSVVEISDVYVNDAPAKEWVK